MSNTATQQHSNTMSISAACSDLSELIFEAKVPTSTQDTVLRLIDCLKAEETRLQGLINVKDERIEFLEDDLQLSHMSDDMEGFKQMPGMGTIYYRAENLLDQQLMERLAELVKAKGSLKLLQALNDIKL